MTSLRNSEIAEALIWIIHEDRCSAAVSAACRASGIAGFHFLEVGEQLANPGTARSREPRHSGALRASETGTPADQNPLGSPETLALRQPFTKFRE